MPHALREDTAHEALMHWVFLMEKRFPVLRLLFHVPNGGYRDIQTAQKFQRLGLRPGVPDLLLPVPRQNHIGLALELKRPTCPRSRRGVLSLTQQWWLDQLRDQGWRCEVCEGSEPAIEAIRGYLGM